MPKDKDIIWGKTKKEIIEELIDGNINSLINLEIKERFYSRKVAVGEKKFEMDLGRIQREIVETKEILEFLKEIYKEER